MSFEEKLDYTYEKIEDKNLQESVAEYLLRNYISSYDYNKDFPRIVHSGKMHP